MNAPSKIRLLILTDSQLRLRGGSERHIRHLVNHLDPNQYDIDIIQLGNDSDDRHQPEIDVANASLLRRPIGRLYGASGLRQMWAIWDHIRSRRIQIVQSYHEKSDLISSLLPATPGGPIRISSRRDMGFKRSAAVRIAGGILDKRFDAFVAPSQAIIDQLEERPRLQKIMKVRIPNGVDLQSFGEICQSEVAVIQSLGLPDDALKITCLANLNPVKGHSMLLDALARTGSDSRIHVLLAGGGPLAGALKAQAESLGLTDRVHLLGLVSDVRGLLAASDGMVLASHTEGMSNALLEGLASGLPLIATAVGGNPEVVTEGRNGWLVDAGDARSMAAALTAFEEDADRRSQYGATSRAIAEEQFSVRSMASTFHELYDQLLSNEGRS